MPKDKLPPLENSHPNTKSFSEQSLAILMKEHDTLHALYVHAESSAQNLFNFYLTLVTTVIGAIVVISQMPAPSEFDMIRSKLLITGIIFFATLVGSIYSTALSVRYANMARYAHCLNEIRKNLLASVGSALPDFYESFLHPRAKPKNKRQFLHALDIWLAPTGTYHFFISMINSAFVAIGLWLLMNIAGFTQQNFSQSMVVSLIVFVALYFIHNFFSRFTILRVISKLKASLGTGRDAESILQAS